MSTTMGLFDGLFNLKLLCFFYESNEVNSYQNVNFERFYIQYHTDWISRYETYVLLRSEGNVFSSN